MEFLLHCEVSRWVPPEELVWGNALSDCAAEKTDVPGHFHCLCSRKIAQRRTDKDKLLCARWWEDGERAFALHVPTADGDALECVGWHVDIVRADVEGEPFEACERAEVENHAFLNEKMLRMTAFDLDNAVGVPKDRVVNLPKVHPAESNRRDRVGECVCFLEVCQVFDDHRVDVGKEFENVAWREKRERLRVDFEGERCLVTVLRDEREGLGRVGVRDEEEDVCEVDGLEANGHGLL